MTQYEWMDEFGDNLKCLLREARMSQQELADLSGLSKYTISNYIRAERMPSIKAVLKIAYALDCQLDDLIDFGEPIE